MSKESFHVVCLTAILAILFVWAVASVTVYDCDDLMDKCAITTQCNTEEQVVRRACVYSAKGGV